MNKKLLTLILILCLGAVAYANESMNWRPLTGEADYERDFNETYSIKPNATVDITHAMGDLTVTAWDKEEVRVQARIEVKGDKAEEFGSKIRIEVKEGKDAFEIMTRFPDGEWGDVSFAVALKVHLPSEHPLNAKNSFGAVSINKMRSPVTVVSTSGDLTVQEIKGKITLTASLGKVSVKDCEGAVTVTGHSSNMEIENVRGDLSIENAVGHVGISNVDGSIIVTSASGNIKARGLSYMNKRTRKGNRIDITSAIGLVELSLPDPPSFQLMATVAFGKIISDFDLSNIIKGPDSEVCLTEFGKGQATINIKATNGNVRIKKE